MEPALADSVANPARAAERATWHARMLAAVLPLAAAQPASSSSSTAPDSPRTPAFRWAQRRDSLTVAIDVVGAAVEDAELRPREAAMRLRDRAGTAYALRLPLYAAVNVTAGWWRAFPRSVLLTLQKAAAGPYWPDWYDAADPPPLAVRRKAGVDWERWLDEKRDGVRWNELADRQWEWWRPEQRTAEDEEDDALWGLSTGGGERKDEV